MQFFGGSSLTSVAPESSPAPAAPPGTGTGSNAQVIYVFNRNGVCLLYREWHRPLRTLARNQDQKLMFGLLFSLRSFTAKIDPTSTEHANLGAPLLPGQGCSFHSFKTNTYKLNYMESPSGIKVCRYVIIIFPGFLPFLESSCSYFGWLDPVKIEGLFWITTL
uniref:Trafficking protein particle complex subunit n=1 Tax=Triticum urartu TaxID=4572 RepID=A0A8R7PRD6_TRIUA